MNKEALAEIQSYLDIKCDRVAEGSFAFVFSLVDEAGGHCVGNFKDGNCLMAIAMAIDMMCKDNDIDTHDTIDAMHEIILQVKERKKARLTVIDCQS